jgi:ABC-type phosphate/phosphonate transport system substrate-binding protein
MKGRRGISWRMWGWLLACIGILWTGRHCRAEDAPRQADSIVLVVMDPLAARLSCPCVKGYAQRDYDALAAHLEASLSRPVRIGYGESLSKGLKAAAAKRAHIVIGKDSVVRADAAAAGTSLAAACSLTDKTGSTQTSGLFVVTTDDDAESLDETIDYAIYAGRPEHVEKHDLALAALRAAGLPEPFDVHEFDSCSDAAAEMLEAEQPAQIVAVISSYAKPLLEGCGAVPPGSLRVIGETEPTRFITAFVDEAIALEERDAIRLALLAVADDAKLLGKLESSRGFIRLTTDEGWTGWRGPGRLGHASWLPSELPEKPAVVWSQPLVQGGLGGIAATRTHVVMGDRDDTDERDVFKCFDAETGELLWEVAYDAPGQLDYGNSPRATPLIENGRVHLLGAMGDLHCAALATGEVLWRRHLMRDFAVPKTAFSAWGYCYSPLVADGRLIVSPGAADAAVVALDPATGAELWRAPGRAAGYGSFVAAYPGGRGQVIGFDETTLGGWDVATGRRLWEWKPPVGGGFNVPTPVIVQDDPLRILVSTETDGTCLLSLGPDGILAPQALAQSEDLSAEMATPVVVGKHVIGVQDRLVALDAGDALRTVAAVEDPSLATYAAVISGPTNVLVIGNGGRLAIYDVAEDGCRLNSTTTVLPASEPSDAKCPIYSHPALVGTRLYIRGGHDLVCVDLAAQED